MRGIRLITLDLDDTLWPCMPVIMAAEQHLFDWLQANTPRLAAAHSIESLRAERKELGHQRPEIVHDMTLLRLESLRQLMTAFGYDASLAEAATHEFRQARNRVEPYAEVRAALARLKPHFTLVSVTNGNAQVEQTPLADAFHLNLGAAEVGAAKPDPALFTAAMAYAEVTPEAALHVGDHPLLDIQAARDAGMRTAWIDRGLLAWPEEVPPADLNLPDMAALADRLLAGR